MKRMSVASGGEAGSRITQKTHRWKAQTAGLWHPPFLFFYSVFPASNQSGRGNISSRRAGLGWREEDSEAGPRSVTT